MPTDGDGLEGDTPQFAVPGELVLDTMNQSDGELCWKYMGLGRGWYARFNPEEKDYEVAISQNVPEKTDEGLVVRVETKEYWAFGRMGLLNWFPDTFTSQRLEPVEYRATPFDELGEPETAPIEARSDGGDP